jgi:hypothetical protein
MKILEHRDCQLRVLLGFQLPLKNPGLFNRFEFQNGNCFQLLAQTLGCMGIGLLSVTTNPAMYLLVLDCY